MKGSANFDTIIGVRIGTILGSDETAPLLIAECSHFVAIVVSIPSDKTNFRGHLA